MPPRIEPQEVETYWNIFSTRTGGGKFLTGEQAAPLLKNSGLRDDQLEKVWDVADVDNDGNLDFEEFCVAMRIIFDIVNGELPDVPNAIPDWLVPESKAHLVHANRALTGKQVQFERPEDDDDDLGLKDGFDWYMNPQDKAKYEQIYQESRDMRGEISFHSLTDLYESLDVPDTDITTAWNLVNPSARSTINKDACLAFLHMLNNRHEGYRIPRSVPASLRATFEQGKIDYGVDSKSAAAKRWGAQADEETSTGRKARFGDQYLTRLGRSGFKSSGTDFSNERANRDDEWEEVRLKKQLADLEGKMEKVEKDAELKRIGRGQGSRESKPALVKRELEQLLDYKRKQLRDLETGEGKGKGGGSLRGVQEDLDSMKEMVEGLEGHLARRRDVLEQLRREIEDEKAGRTGVLAIVSLLQSKNPRRIYRSAVAMISREADLDVTCETQPIGRVDTLPSFSPTPAASYPESLIQFHQSLETALVYCLHWTAVSRHPPLQVDKEKTGSPPPAHPHHRAVLGNLVISLIALFIAFSASQIWGIFAFIVHQLRACRQPQTTPVDLLVDIVEISWAYGTASHVLRGGEQMSTTSAFMLNLEDSFRAAREYSRACYARPEDGREGAAAAEFGSTECGRLTVPVVKTERVESVDCPWDTWRQCRDDLLMAGNLQVLRHRSLMPTLPDGYWKQEVSHFSNMSLAFLQHPVFYPSDGASLRRT
ncbi:hypothetical protein MKZ38_001080 [Zalerion maritima]|uniref:Endocytosis protein 3 n=1 Tax=Zalerion maritima TaxID=339359 RepID=A0AAD5WTH4_9PEZI|nr:hypothetical protein MKZ38_001080 [Zalerion maritima]